jgi:hypothetical protein
MTMRIAILATVSVTALNVSVPALACEASQARFELQSGDVWISHAERAFPTNDLPTRPAVDQLDLPLGDTVGLPMTGREDAQSREHKIDIVLTLHRSESLRRTVRVRRPRPHRFVHRQDCFHSSSPHAPWLGLRSREDLP